MWASTSLRLAAIYIFGFCLAVALMGLVTVNATRAALTRQFEARIYAELSGLREDFRQGGVSAVVDEIGEHHDGPADLSYGLESSGKPIAGRLAGLHPPLGWSMARPAPGQPRVRMLTVDVGGDRLAVGDDWDRIAALDQEVARTFALAFAGILVFGIAVGVGFSHAVRRRLGAISGTAEAIIDGDLSRRVRVKGNDDLGRLAQTINRMLDRITTLMESLRQVSSDVAHDLRTPLTRLRQRLELSAGRAADPAQRREIEGAIHDVDAILGTFAALLRIAEVESGFRRSAFQRIDLAELARTVVDDFAPAAEDGGRSLTFEGEAGPALVEGDRVLIVQMLINLVENSLRHTQGDASVRVRVEAGADQVVLSVLDNGPGVPAENRGRVLDRFYRLERSRSTAGSGLGLSLAAAVAQLHRGQLTLADAAPGLEVRALFPPADSR